MSAAVPYWIEKMGEKLWGPSWSERPRNDITFQENIEMAHLYLKQYLKESIYTQWYHIMVSAGTCKSFEDAVNKGKGFIRCLPFWCWCDGDSRHHRHVILITPWSHNNFLSNCFEKIKINDTNFEFARYVKINSWLDLVNTLFYVSNPCARCNFIFNEDVDCDARVPTQQWNHYFVSKSLPHCSRLCLALVAEMGGYRKILSPDLYEAQTNHWVLPVQKKWRPVGIQDKPGEAFLYLGSRYLNFVKDPKMEELSHKEWLKVQIAGGNDFYSVLKKDSETYPLLKKATIKELEEWNEKIKEPYMYL